LKAKDQILFQIFCLFNYTRQLKFSDLWHQHTLVGRWSQTFFSNCGFIRVAFKCLRVETLWAAQLASPDA